MPEHDQERKLTGETAEDADQLKYQTVKSGLVEYARTRKGLPVQPIELDLGALSQLSDADVIDQNSDQTYIEPARVIDISHLTANHSAFGLVTLERRMSKLEKKAA